MIHERPAVFVYVVDEFPTLTETFVINEIAQLRKEGLTVWVYPLRKGPVTGMGEFIREACIATPPSVLTLTRPLIANLVRFPRLTGRLSGLLLALRRTGPKAAAAELWVLAHALRLNRLLKGKFGETGLHLHAHFAGRTAEVCDVLHEIEGHSYSVTVHAADIYAPQDFNRMKRSLDHANFIVCTSDYIKRFLIDRQISHDVDKVVIRYGIDVRSFAHVSRPRKNTSIPRVLAVGRLVEKKGFRYLIEAATILNSRGLRIDWLLVGSGPLEKQLRSLAETLQCSEYFHFLGPRTHQEICTLLQEADVFTLPCTVAQDGDMDGIPNVLMEAMASGVPVVSTKVSGIPELIEHQKSGLLVSPNDAVSLADGIARLLNDEGLVRELSSNGRITVEREFNLEKQSSLLKQLMEVHSGRP